MELRRMYTSAGPH